MKVLEAIDRNGNKIMKGTLVSIVGSIKISEEVVGVTSSMKKIISDQSNRLYPIEDIKITSDITTRPNHEKHKFLIHVKGWWWSCNNIQLIDKDTKIKLMTHIEPIKFNPELLLTP